MYRIFVSALVVLNLSATPLLAQRFHGFVPRPVIISPNVSFVSRLPAGNFVHVTAGNFVPSSRSFAPGATGNAFLTGQGVFTPMRGTFVPALNGNFLLTIRESFNPKTASFTPSPTGNFTLTFRGDLVASSTGMAAGSFLPFVPFVPLTSSLRVTSFVPTTNPYLGGLTNPYTAALSNPYLTPYAMPYPAPYYSMPYSAPNNYGAAAAASAMPAANIAPQTPAGTDMLGAYGIPSENGHVKWPLAFRLLPADKQQDLLQPLERELLSATTRASGGAADAPALGEAQRVLTRLSAWIKAHQTDMAEGTYRDGVNFLRTLDEALTALQ